MSNRLSSKVPVMTGASKGIGAGIADRHRPRVVFPASDDSARVTGEVIWASGGLK